MPIFTRRRMGRPLADARLAARLLRRHHELPASAREGANSGGRHYHYRSTTTTTPDKRMMVFATPEPGQAAQLTSRSSSRPAAVARANTSSARTSAPMTARRTPERYKDSYSAMPAMPSRHASCQASSKYAMPMRWRCRNGQARLECAACVAHACQPPHYDCKLAFQ